MVRKTRISEIISTNLTKEYTNNEAERSQKLSNMDFEVLGCSSNRISLGQSRGQTTLKISSEKEELNIK